MNKTEHENPGAQAIDECQKLISAYNPGTMLSFGGHIERVRALVTGVCNALGNAISKTWSRLDGRCDDIDDAIRGTREWAYHQIRRAAAGEEVSRYDNSGYAHDGRLEGTETLHGAQVAPPIARALTDDELAKAIDQTFKHANSWASFADSAVAKATLVHLEALFREQARRATLGRP